VTKREGTKYPGTEGTTTRKVTTPRLFLDPPLFHVYLLQTQYSRPIQTAHRGIKSFAWICGEYIGSSQSEASANNISASIGQYQSRCASTKPNISGRDLYGLKKFELRACQDTKNPKERNNLIRRKCHVVSKLAPKPHTALPPLALRDGVSIRRFQGGIWTLTGRNAAVFGQS
jgi:hypothetical protein